jgi:hypothetical protein
MKVTSDPRVKVKFASYPDHVRARMTHLRSLVVEAAREAGIDSLEETLKWGEPSYLAKKGSTLRMDWNEKAPKQYALYFKCTSKLIATIQEVFGEDFKYEKTRAILFDLEDEVPKDKIKTCITMALTYHKVKHLPLLGYTEQNSTS